MSLPDWAVQALVTALVGIVTVILVRVLATHFLRRYERRLASRDPSEAARKKTLANILARVLVAVVAFVFVWALLSSIPATKSLAQAALASGAVLAIFIGVAVSTPLGNLGAGVLLAFTQPIRLGDRISIADQTGVVDEMSLSYTVLLTDEGRHVFVPNLQIVSAVVVNRSVGDARRVVTVEVPVALGAPLDTAQAVTRDATAAIARDRNLDVDVRVGNVGEKIVWLTVVAMAPPDADVGRIASDVRSAALGALASAELLPAA